MHAEAGLPVPINTFNVKKGVDGSMGMIYSCSVPTQMKYAYHLNEIMRIIGLGW